MWRSRMGEGENLGGTVLNGVEGPQGIKLSWILFYKRLRSRTKPRLRGEAEGEAI